MAADLLEIELYVRVWAKAKPRTRAWFFFWAPREWFWGPPKWEKWSVAVVGNTFGSKVSFKDLCLKNLGRPQDNTFTGRVASWTVERRS